MWTRFVAAAFLIICSFAAATTAVGVRNINHFLHQIKPIQGIEGQLDSVPSGDPQTFLLLGEEPLKPRSDLITWTLWG